MRGWTGAALALLCLHCASSAQTQPTPQATALLRFLREKQADSAITAAALKPHVVLPWSAGAIAKDGSALGACAVRLPGKIAPAQLQTVRDGFLSMARQRATVEAISLIARASVESAVDGWKIENPLAVRPLVGFVLEQRLTASIPATATIVTEVIDGAACAYVRIPPPHDGIVSAVRQMRKEDAIAGFGAWAIAKARAAVRHGDYAAAIDLLLLARGADPEDISFLGLAMQGLSGLRRADDVRKVGQYLLSRTDAKPPLLIEAAGACEQAGELRLAILLYDRVLVLDPGNADAQQGRARSFEQLPQPTTKESGHEPPSTNITPASQPDTQP
jgi:hypothetical protein